MKEAVLSMQAPPAPGIDHSASNPDSGEILKHLRNILPRHQPIATFSHQHCAETQADMLLRMSGVSAPPVPEDIITSIPIVRVEYTPRLPVSGATIWTGKHWLISIAAEDHTPRQRFTLAHEFKHIIDHRDIDHLYRDHGGISAQHHAESIADHFGMCLLMPRQWVREAWEHDQSAREDDLAQLFDVTPRLMLRRLWQLGLSICGPTCHSFAATSYRHPHPTQPGEPR